jgi:putative membrane protein
MIKLKNISVIRYSLSDINWKNEYGVMLFTIVLFAVGLILHGIPALRHLAIKITEAFLFTINFLVFIIYIRKNFSYKFLFGSLLIFLITLLTEVIGVKTGKIFGHYQYGNAFTITLLNVPLVIGFNWLMLILSANSLMKNWLKSHFMITISAASLVMLFDIILEPVAIKLDYWSWPKDVVPFRNYIAWFVIAFIFSIFLRSFTLKSNLLKSYIIIQMLFFVIISFLI